MTKCFILLLLFTSALGNEDITLGMSSTNPANSCIEIYQRNPTSRGSIGQYWIKTNEGLFNVTCNMKLSVEGGWMQVVDIIKIYFSRNMAFDYQSEETLFRIYQWMCYCSFCREGS